MQIQPPRHSTPQLTRELGIREAVMGQVRMEGRWGLSSLVGCKVCSSSSLLAQNYWMILFHAGVCSGECGNTHIQNLTGRSIVNIKSRHPKALYTLHVSNNKKNILTSSFKNSQPTEKLFHLGPAIASLLCSS